MPDDDGQQQNPANSTQGQGGVSLFTQEQVNAIAANEKRGALTGFFKQLGFDSPPSEADLKAALTDAGEYRKQQDGKKDEVQRLTEELNTYKPQAETQKVQLSQARIAADMGLKPRYWKYIEGSSEDDIKASVTEILQDVRGGGDGSGDDQGDQQDQEQDQQRQEGGRRPAPLPQQGRGGGGQPKSSLAAGAEAYKARHKKE